jgi:RNA polymerase sigma-70 factor (ECF subfamily)
MMPRLAQAIFRRSTPISTVWDPDTGDDDMTIEGQPRISDLSSDEEALVDRLRAGEESTFASLVERYQGSLLRLARTFVHDHAAAEDVVQQTWLGLLEGLDRFEGRSSLKTYLFRILVNCAKTRARKDGRTIPFSSLFNADSEGAEPAVEPERFHAAGGPLARHWADAPKTWAPSPEGSALSSETRRCIESAIAELPASQREVITLRDLEGLGSEEVCNVLQLTDTNQRVLLHRARSKVRRALEMHFGEGN